MLAACGSSGGGVPTLNWYIGKQSGGWIEHAIDECNKSAAGKYKIKFQELPARATDQREQLVRRLAANDSSIDIVGMDVIWTAEFANAKWIAPFPESQRAALTDGVLQGPVQSGTYQGKLYAAPYTSNTQLLWYRKDLTAAPPENFTWQQMLDDANRQGKQVQIQGARAESLTVTFNALLASAGGRFLNNPEAGKDATVSLEQAPTVAALTALHNLAASPAANPSLNTAEEDSSRQAFEEGNSLYEINYPFIYPSAAESTSVPGLQQKLGWARFPRVDANTPSKPPLGGFNLAVGAASKHKDLAFQAIECIRQPANQLFAAQEGGNPPTTSAVYDQLTTDKYPFKEVLRSSINDAEPRPVSPAYNDLSLAVQNTIHPLSGVNPTADAIALRKLSEQALKSEAVLS
ncbi:MAG: trehalose/maltose transport system substrate-binding protein [Frankiaceae bacterium]|jgi:multiple sugar transport system substrate-binding protein|nr:trehalose/maltose transport system substrate-binding protein [Frankiaceae bacterium]